MRKRESDCVIQKMTRLRRWYIRARIWIGLKLFVQHSSPFNEPGRIYNYEGKRKVPPVVINIGFGQCIKRHAITSGILAQDYVARYTSTPAPRVLGAWREEDEPLSATLMMSWLPGRTLKEAWPTLKKQKRDSLARQLRGYVSEWRKVPQPSNFTGVIGSFVGGPVDDAALDRWQLSGPFPNFDDFLEYLVHPFTDAIEDHEAGHEFRKTLNVKREDPLVLTHGDLTLRNIIIDDTGDNIVGIVDWDTAAWMPSFWEGYKAFFTMDRRTRLRKLFTIYATQADMNDIKILETREAALIPKRELLD